MPSSRSIQQRQPGSPLTGQAPPPPPSGPTPTHHHHHHHHHHRHQHSQAPGNPTFSGSTPLSSSAMTPSPSSSSVKVRSDGLEKSTLGRITLHLVFPFSFHRQRQEQSDVIADADSPAQQGARQIAPEKITAKPRHTVRRIKIAVHNTWPGKPSVNGMRIIYAGRILHDDELVADIDAVKQGQTEAYLHLVVRPDAWEDVARAPLTPQPRDPSIATSRRDQSSLQHHHHQQQQQQPQPQPQAPPARLRPAVDPLEGSTYFALPTSLDSSVHQPNVELSQPITLRDLVECPNVDKVLTDIHARYHNRYSELYARYTSTPRVIDDFLAQRPTGRAADYRKASDAAFKAALELESLVFQWDPFDFASSTTAVATDTSAAQAELRLCTERMQAIRDLLEQIRTSRSHVLARGYDAVDLRAFHRQAQRTSAQVQAAAMPTREMMVAALQAQAEAQGQRLVQLGQDGQAQTQQPTATRPNQSSRSAIWRLTFRDMFQIMVPIFFLSLKLTILLYVCTQGMSKRKKSIMYAVAVLWIAFETWRAWKRRIRRLDSTTRRAHRNANTGRPRDEDADRQRREREERRRRRAADEPQGSTSALTDQFSNPLLPVAPRRFTATSFSSVDFWRQRIAFYGLEEEDQDLGFRPTTSQASSWAIRSARQRLATAALNLPRRPGLQDWLTRTITHILNFIKALPGILAYAAYIYCVSLIPQLEELRASEVRRRQRAIQKWWDARGKEWVDNVREQRLKESESQQDANTTARSPDHTVLPRILQHPYTLAVLQLQPTPDGLVGPANNVDGQGSLVGDPVQAQIDYLNDVMRDARRERNARPRQTDGTLPVQQATAADASGSVSSTTASRLYAGREITASVAVQAPESSVEHATSSFSEAQAAGQSAVEGDEPPPIHAASPLALNRRAEQPVAGSLAPEDDLEEDEFDEEEETEAPLEDDEDEGDAENDLGFF